MSLGDHLDELRTRLIRIILGLTVALVAALLIGSRVIDLLKTPYVKAMASIGQPTDLTVLNVTAGLTTYLRVSLITAIVIAAPWIFYQLWMFIAVGLHPRERRMVLLAVPMSAGLFMGGALFFVFVVATQVLTFFININKWLHLESAVTFSNHVDLMLTMSLVFAIAFQTPLIVLLLGKMGVVTVKSLCHYRRHVIVAILVLAAMFTPPDPMSQMCLALPLWALYELGILLVRLFVRKRAPAGD